jgi:hypothetical protein
MPKVLSIEGIDLQNIHLTEQEIARQREDDDLFINRDRRTDIARFVQRMQHYLDQGKELGCIAALATAIVDIEGMTEEQHHAAKQSWMQNLTRAFAEYEAQAKAHGNYIKINQI